MVQFTQYAREITLRDGPLENLWGRRAGEVQKKYSRKGKLKEKIRARQLILKNIHATAKEKFMQGI